MIMKIKIIAAILTCLLASSLAYAHCPSAFKEEKVCLMLDDNTLYIYDEKIEHNGPYKDFLKAQVESIKTMDNKKLEFKKLARGIYKFQSTAKEKNILLEVSLDKKKKEIKVVHE